MPRRRSPSPLLAAALVVAPMLALPAASAPPAPAGPPAVPVRRVELPPLPPPCLTDAPAPCGEGAPAPAPAALLVMETEVTQALWAEVMGRANGGAAACGPTCPVWNVQWHEAVQFANALSRRDGLEACYGWPDGQLQWLRGPACAGWRLPTDAEWEVAAGEPPPADGGEGRVSFGPGVEGRPPPTHGGAAAGDPARPPAWTEATSGGAQRPVATSAPNRHGLFDMRGNVWEWVWDGEDLGTTAGRLGPPAAIPRRARGGSWRDPDGASHLEVAQGDLTRLVNGDLGLRLVRAAP